MSHKFAMCITVWLVIATTGYVVQGCLQNTVRGWLTSGIFLNTRMASSTRCQRLCWYTMTCSSCSWGSHSNACRLSKETKMTSPGSFSAISNYIHSDVLSLPCKKKAHACANRPCGAQEVCIPTEATKSYICLKDKLLLMTLATAVTNPLTPEVTSSPAITSTATTEVSVTTTTSATTAATEETTFSTKNAEQATSSADTTTTTVTVLAVTTTASTPAAATTVQDIAPMTTTLDDVATTATTDAVTTAAPDAVTTAAPDAVTTAAPDVVTTTATTAVVTTTTTTDVVTTTDATTTSVTVTTPTTTKTTSVSTAATTTAGKGIANCVKSCEGIVAGFFHSCDRCDTYVRCSNEILSIMDCTGGTLWNDVNKGCNFPPSPTCP